MSDPDPKALVRYLRKEAQAEKARKTAFVAKWGNTGGAHFVRRARKLNQAADLIERLTQGDASDQ